MYRDFLTFIKFDKIVFLNKHGLPKASSKRVLSTSRSEKLDLLDLFKYNLESGF